MSMEIYVLSKRRLVSIEDWQRAIDGEGFDLRLYGEAQFDAIKGHLPARWKEKPAGFECDHWNANELMKEHPEIDFRIQWPHALAFRWGADLNACQGANMAASAYAAATDGVVFDPESGTLLSPAEATARVHEMERLLPAIEAAMRAQ